MMGKIRCNRKTPSQVAPNSNLLIEDSQSDDPGQVSRAAIRRSLANENLAETSGATGTRSTRLNRTAKPDKVASTLEEFVELLAIRVSWLDKMNSLTDDCLNRFCDQQMEDIVNEFENIMVLNVQNIATIFRFFTSSLNSFQYGTETWLLAEKIRKRLCKHVIGGRPSDEPAFLPDDYTYDFGQLRYKTPLRPIETWPYTNPGMHPHRLDADQGSDSGPGAYHSPMNSAEEEVLTVADQTNKEHEARALAGSYCQTRLTTSQPQPTRPGQSKTKYVSTPLPFSLAHHSQKQTSRLRTVLPHIHEQYSAELIHGLSDIQTNVDHNQRTKTAQQFTAAMATHPTPANVDTGDNPEPTATRPALASAATAANPAPAASQKATTNLPMNNAAFQLFNPGLVVDPPAPVHAKQIVVQAAAVTHAPVIAAQVANSNPLLRQETDRLMKELRIAHDQRVQDQELIRRAQLTTEEALKAVKQATHERLEAVRAQQELEKAVKTLVADKDKITAELYGQRLALASHLEQHEQIVERFRQDQINNRTHLNQVLDQHRLEIAQLAVKVSHADKVEAQPSGRKQEHIASTIGPVAASLGVESDDQAPDKCNMTSSRHDECDEIEVSHTDSDRRDCEIRDRMAELERLVASLKLPVNAQSSKHPSSLRAKPGVRHSKAKQVSFGADTTDYSDTSYTSAGEMTEATDDSEEEVLSTTDGGDESSSEKVGRRRGGQNFMLAPPPVFNQVCSKDEDMHDWFKQFEKYALASGWDSRTMASQAAVNFHNVAEEYLEELSKPERKDYKTVKRHMLKRMKLPGAESRNCSEYQAIHQLANESSAQFANRIQLLVSKTPSLKREKSESSIAKHFVERSAPAISAILSVRRFKNLQEARKYAERIDTSTKRNQQRMYQEEIFVNAIQQQVPTSYSQPRQTGFHQHPSSFSPQFRNQSASLTQQPAQQQQPSAKKVGFSDQSRPNYALTCLNCNSSSHLLLECPTLDRTQNCDYCGRRGHPTRCCIDKHLNRAPRFLQSGNGPTSGSGTTRAATNSSLVGTQ